MPPFMAAVDIDVNYVAHLARLALSAEEAKRSGAQLASLFGTIENLKEVAVEGSEPLAPAFLWITATRPDKARPPRALEKASGNAPAKAKGCLSFPRSSNKSG